MPRRGPASKRKRRQRKPQTVAPPPKTPPVTAVKVQGPDVIGAAAPRSRPGRPARRHHQQRVPPGAGQPVFAAAAARAVPRLGQRGHHEQRQAVGRRQRGLGLGGRPPARLGAARAQVAVGLRAGGPSGAGWGGPGGRARGQKSAVPIGPLGRLSAEVAGASHDGPPPSVASLTRTLPIPAPPPRPVPPPPRARTLEA
jgi:hypothetical protein